MIQNFVFQKASLQGLTLITPFYAPDQRGYLSKTFDMDLFESNGILFKPVEELESQSSHGTIRGLHFQRRHSQDKVVRVLSGEIYDVAVDLRPTSKTFGKWQGFYLSSENRRMLYIPKEFAHGFLVVSRTAVVHYLCGDCYDPDSEDGIIWNDHELRISWPLETGQTPELSERDKHFSTFAEYRNRN